MASDLVLTPGRVASYVGKPGPGGYKVYLTSRDGRSWVEFGGRGVASNPLSMPKQPNLGFQSEDDAWSFAENIVKQFPTVAENPRAVFRLYDYEHTAEFYLTRSRPLRIAVFSENLPTAVIQLFDERRDPKKYERPNRPNQAEFRKVTLHRYGSQCAFCRISSDALLDAAHIIAWNQRGADVAENGMVLCKLHHRALDTGLIRINPSTQELEFANGRLAVDLHAEVADIRHLPALPDGRALMWLYDRTKS